MDTLWSLGEFAKSVVTASAVFVIAAAGFVRLKQLPFYRKLMAFPHVPEAVPLVVHLVRHVALLWREHQSGIPYGVHFFREIARVIKRFRKEGCFTIFIGTVPNLMIYRADHIEKVLSSTVNITKGTYYSFLHPWLGLGLLTSTGSKWKTRRKLLTPAFHFRILDEFATVMNEQAKIFVGRMGAKSPTEDIVPYVTAVTLDIVCETVMGVRMKSQTTGNGRKYLNSLKALGHRLLDRIQSPSQWIEFLYRFTQASRDNARDLKELHSFTEKLINERKAELQAEPDKLEEMAATEGGIRKSTKPFLDLLLIEHMKRKTMSITDIREEVDTFLFEGHDTTSMGITWAIYLLGLHSDVQKKIQKEIDDIFHGDTEAKVTAEHIKKMKYLEIAVKETQRLFPPVPVISRTVTKEFKLDGKAVPVGTQVICHIWELHKDPDVFPDPFKFDPDRFLPENSTGRSPFAFVPFSGGPRNCIGQRFALLEEKILLVHLLRKYNLKSFDPLEKINITVEMVLLPKSPIRVQCTPR
ncbi:cytochrome P450 4V2-like [Tropilaelaps mercedesae]|uniref:Cytochrome P450 4V2-like n=1 Tax=Tropilaelaps mercedesae TaxID=418985 RepID=A0A1V9XE13_9ACAR|nr:cytochrome P450 4V2-like [Tropilaelaps mercedesae]